MTITDPTVVNDGAPSKPRSAIAVVPFDPARDAEAFCRARVLAFDDTAISQAMWPEPRPSVEDRIRWAIRSDSRSRYVAPETVERTALLDGKPVGFAIWSSPLDRTATLGEPTAEEMAAEAGREAELEATKEAVDREPEAHFDKGFYKRFKKAMAAGRKARYQGRPYWLLGLLLVNPAAQGLGVGKALLAWGLDRADREGLPVYLEATTAGQPMYERAGFEIVGQVVIEGSELTLPAMERPPQPVASLAAEDDKSSEPAGSDDIVLSPVEDADWPELVRTRLLAMEDNPSYATYAPKDLRPDLATRIRWGVYSQRRLSPEVARSFAVVKATRRSAPTVILGFAKWEKPRKPSEPQPDPATATASSEPVDEELEALFAKTERRDYVQDWGSRASKMRADYHAGAPYWYLSLLVVNPEAQGLGIGKKLMQWAFDRADADGLPVHCESSPIAEPFYERCGFEAIGWLDWTHHDGYTISSPSYCRKPKKTA